MRRSTTVTAMLATLLAGTQTPRAISKAQDLADAARDNCADGVSAVDGAYTALKAGNDAVQTVVPHDFTLGLVLAQGRHQQQALAAEHGVRQVSDGCLRQLAEQAYSDDGVALAARSVEEARTLKPTTAPSDRALATGVLAADGAYRVASALAYVAQAHGVQSFGLNGARQQQNVLSERTR